MLKNVFSKNGLSTRESEVASLVTTGLSNKEVADKLFVTEKTIKFHLTNIYRKLNMKSRAQLIVWSLPHLSFIHNQATNNSFVPTTVPEQMSQNINGQPIQQNIANGNIGNTDNVRPITNSFGLRSNQAPNPQNSNQQQSPGLPTGLAPGLAKESQTRPQQTQNTDDIINLHSGVINGRSIPSGNGSGQGNGQGSGLGGGTGNAVGS